MKTYDLKELSTATKKIDKTGGAFTGAVTSNSNITTTGTLTANKLVKSSGTNSQILLANGDTKAVSSFLGSGNGTVSLSNLNSDVYTTSVDTSNKLVTSSAVNTKLTGYMKTNPGGTSSQFIKGDGSMDSTRYSIEGHAHDDTYLKLAGGTLTGAVSSNSNITTTGNVTGAKIIKSSGTSSQILLANGDTKPTGDFATSGHVHGNISNDGKIIQNNDFAEFSTLDVPIVADGSDNYKLKPGFVNSVSVASSDAIPSLDVSQGLNQHSINLKIAAKLTQGWSNVTSGSGEINGVTYKQYVNGWGTSVITMKGTLTADSSGTSDQVSIARVNQDYPPVGETVPNNATSYENNGTAYCILHNQGSIMGRLVYNTISNVSQWRVMIINHSSTAKPTINGRLVYNYNYS